MADVLTETVLPEDLKKFEQIYHGQLYKNDVTPKAQFDYAFCLVRSKYPADIQKGIALLEDLYRTNEEGQRDYLYYLAIGTARLKEYSKALGYVRSFLSIEPGK
ncbi:mitochondrial fission 1 protein-like [Sitophilus oryzae]|uniref:Mitochondrial fission 1 protein-like n=1 Tax=Sitophilus oryzae TaxID=7048 RepID=A0A6J2X5I0_SITOR|nr:mitochondrial fission 1 protein-like [Sitophilus oryzae]